MVGATAMMVAQNDECGEEYVSEIGWIGRRDVVRLLGIGGAALAAGLPKRVHAAASGSTLVLGIDISDSITFDPAREAQYTAPLSLRAAYESLVTMSPVIWACCSTAVAMAAATSSTSPIAVATSRTASIASTVAARIATICAVISSVARAV